MRKLFLTLALALSSGLAFAKPTGQAAAPLLKATPAQTEAAIWATRFLTRFHYKPMPLDDAMSEQIFKRYLDALDGDRLFFTQADIDRFGVYKDTLDDAIYDQDLAAPFAIFNVYEQRVGERVAYARSAARQGLRFQQGRELPVRPREGPLGARTMPRSTTSGASASRTTGCA